jgi:hypothetical protein
VLLETERGEITSVFGKGVKSRSDGKARIVQIRGIRKKQSRKVLVEMKLRAGEQEQTNTLRFRIRSPAADPKKAKKPSTDAETINGQTISMSWPVASCGRQFHSALIKIGEAGGNSLRNTWRAAQTPDKTMSRRWYFRPLVPKRSRRSGSDSADGPVSRSRERAIFTEAARRMSAGYERDIGRRGKYGWTIAKTTNDLKTYFSQEHNPAICTGALGFAAYFEDQLSPLGERSTKLASLVSDAALLARARAVELVENTRNLPGGHPAWGGARLDAIKPSANSGDDLKSVLVQMLQAVNAGPDAIEETAAADDIHSAIKHLDKIGLKAAGVTSKSSRSELGQAIATIEAAVRLAAYRDQFDIFWKGVSGPLDAIRSAYAKHCVCGTEVSSALQ